MNLVVLYKSVLKELEELKSRVSKLEAPPVLTFTLLEPAKKKRGRPRKNPEIPVPVKKKRGRPRKT